VSSNASFMLGLVVVGLVLTAVSITGIVWLARRLKGQSSGLVLLYAFAMLFLAMVGFAGLASIGCAAVMPNHL